MDQRPGDSDNVEANRVVIQPGILLQETLGCPRNPLALGRANARGRRYGRPGVTVPDFNDDELVVVSHHEVQLPQRAAVISRNQPQPASLQVACSDRFGPLAARQVWRLLSPCAVRRRGEI